MNTLFAYLLKAALYLISFYLIYSVFLIRDTTHSRNRAFVLLSLFASSLFPLITFTPNIRILNIQFFGKLLSEVLVTPGGNTVEKTSSVHALSQTIFWLYLVIALISLLKVLFDFANLLFLIVRHRNKGSRIIRFTGLRTSGFSAMGYIFINTLLNPEDEDEIIRHEQNHLKQNHFLDIILIEIVKTLQWFNPAVYMFNRSLRAIHEYQADEKCLKSGVSIVRYQSLLLNQIFKSGTFNLTNSFTNPSLLKKRMLMMTRKRTSPFANSKIILVIPVIAILFISVSASKTENATQINQQPAEKTIIDESNIKPFIKVDQMPEFPGGESALLKYIGENIHYPESALIRGQMGKVIVRFCINSDGSTCLVSVVQSVSPDLDNEAMRVVKSMPAFQPGRNDGIAVPVWYMVPISFSLK